MFVCLLCKCLESTCVALQMWDIACLGFSAFLALICGRDAVVEVDVCPGLQVWFNDCLVFPLPEQILWSRQITEGCKCVTMGTNCHKYCHHWALICTFHPTNLVKLILGALICLLQSVFNVIIFQCFSSLFIMSYCKCIYHVCLQGVEARQNAIISLKCVTNQLGIPRGIQKGEWQRWGIYC